MPEPTRITGRDGSGIGRAIAVRVAAEGTRVVAIPLMSRVNRGTGVNISGVAGPTRLITGQWLSPDHGLLTV